MPSLAEEHPAYAVRLDRAGTVPLHAQLARQLEDAVLTGRIAPGDRLPNELDLVAELGLSRPTVRQAIGYLVQQGLLVRKRGVGTQVVLTRVHRPLRLSSLHDDLDAAGQHPSTRVLGLDVVACDEVVAVALGLERAADAVRIRRLRLAAGEPIAVMTNHLPVGLIELDPERLARQGLYSMLRDAGVALRVARQSVGAGIADADQARLLREPVGAPLLRMTRTAFDDTGSAVEYGSHVYRGSRYSFEVTLVER